MSGGLLPAVVILGCLLAPATGSCLVNGICYMSSFDNSTTCSWADCQSQSHIVITIGELQLAGSLTLTLKGSKQQRKNLYFGSTLITGAQTITLDVEYAYIQNLSLAGPELVIKGSDSVLASIRSSGAVSQSAAIEVNASNLLLRDVYVNASTFHGISLLGSMNIDAS